MNSFAQSLKVFLWSVLKFKILNVYIVSFDPARPSVASALCRLCGKGLSEAQFRAGHGPSAAPGLLPLEPVCSP